MSTKFYVDITGKYLGGFAGIEPKDGSIEIESPPVDGRLKWDGSKWVEPDDFYLIQREEEKLNQGISLAAKVEALWTQATTGKADLKDILYAKEQAIDAQFQSK